MATVVARSFDFIEAQSSDFFQILFLTFYFVFRIGYSDFPFIVKSLRRCKLHSFNKIIFQAYNLICIWFVISPRVALILTIQSQCSLILTIRSQCSLILTIRSQCSLGIITKLIFLSMQNVFEFGIYSIKFQRTVVIWKTKRQNMLILFLNDVWNQVSSDVVLI
jgi:hypothetical protein